MVEKLRRYAIAAGILLLIICLASLLQHWDYIAAAFAAGIRNLVSGLFSTVVTLLVLFWILRLFLGGWRR